MELDGIDRDAVIGGEFLVGASERERVEQRTLRARESVQRIVQVPHVDVGKHHPAGSDVGGALEQAFGGLRVREETGGARGHRALGHVGGVAVAADHDSHGRFPFTQDAGQVLTAQGGQIPVDDRHPGRCGDGRAEEGLGRTRRADETEAGVPIEDLAEGREHQRVAVRERDVDRHRSPPFPGRRRGRTPAQLTGPFDTAVPPNPDRLLHHPLHSASELPPQSATASASWQRSDG